MLNPRPESAFAFAFAAIALLIAAPAALAQADAVALDTEGFLAKESTQGVYVRDSAVALEKFPLIDRLERMNEWGKAAELFQEVLEEFPDRVIQTGTDNEGIIVRYTGIANAVTQRIARWPAAGLEAYRARFEPAAQAQLMAASADDLDALQAVYARYFNTRPGLIAGIRLVDGNFRAGELRAARQIAEHLLGWHPLVGDDRPMLLFRAGLLAHLTGDAAAAQQYLARLTQDFPAATGTVGGDTVNLADSLRADLDIPPAVAKQISPESWPMFAGDPSRARVSTASGKTGARLFQIPLGNPDPSASNPQPGDRAIPIATPLDGTSRISVMPVVDRNELFFQDGRNIYGVSLESGLPLPQWAATHAATGGVYTTDSPALPLGQQLNLTVTDDAVVAIMGFPANPGNSQGARTRIVCLDRATGRQRWVFRSSDMPNVDSQRFLTFSGSPLIIGDTIHFLGRGGKSAQFEDCYLITIDRKTGNHLRSTYIASAGSQQANFFARGAATPAGDTTSHVAYGNGRLFVLTNLGAVAAVDAYSGTIDWLALYKRNISAAADRARFGARPAIELAKPWTFNPVILQDDHLFVLPTDSGDVLIYNAATGEQIKSIRAAHMDRPDTLVGVYGDNLVVAGGDHIKSLNWRHYNAETYSDRNVEMINWPRRFSGSPIRGRPFMTTQSIFVPTQRRLYLMDQESGRVIASHPAENAAEWEGGGNIIVAGDRVVIATAASVDVYTDLSVAIAKLDDEVAGAPRDPQVRLRYAEVMFVAGQDELSLAKLDEAIDLMGGLDALRPGPARERLFYTALIQAQQAAWRSGEASAPLAGEFFDRAAAAAESSSQHVQYRISRARHAQRRDQAREAVTFYQQILDNPEWRMVTVNDARWDGATQAAVVAEHEIAALIRKFGRDVYAEFDALAEQAIAAAAVDPDLLLAIPTRYPNARIAPQALLQAAQAFEATGNHRRATQTLRQVSYKFPDAFNKAEIVESMARNYLAMPNRLEVALSRLEYGVRTAGNPRLTQPLRLPDGTVIENVTFSQAIESLRPYADRAKHKPAPDFRLPTREWGMVNRGKSPFPQAARQVIADVDALVEQMPDQARYDRILTWSQPDNGEPARTAIHAVGQSTPLGMTTALTDTPEQAAWTDAGLVLWTPNQVILLDPDNAQVRWEQRLDTLLDIQLVESDADRTAPRDIHSVAGTDNTQLRRSGQRVVNTLLRARPKYEGDEQYIQAHITSDRVLLATSTGRLIALNLADGTLAWQSRLLENIPLDRLVATDDFTVVRLLRDNRVDLVTFDTYSGELISRRGFANSTGAIPINFALAPDGTLVYILSDRICGKDLFDPGEQLTWEVTAQTGGQPVYEGALLPEHLKIHDGRIMVLSDGGQFIRVHSLQTGRMIRYPSGRRNREVEALLSTGNTDWRTRLVIDGSSLYCVSPRALVAYNLENPEQTWRGPNDPATTHSYRDVLVGQDYLVLVDAPGEGPSVNCTLYAFSRTKTRNGESGLMVHSPTVQERTPIMQWRGVEGGIYYLRGDRTLHFLPGIRE